MTENTTFSMKLENLKPKPNLRRMSFLGFKNYIFSKFCPHCARDFIFCPFLKKFLSAPMIEDEVWAMYLIIKWCKKIAYTFYPRFLSPPWGLSSYATEFQCWKLQFFQNFFSFLRIYKDETWLFSLGMGEGGG